MNIDLKEMTQLAAAFRDLFKGYHISRSEPECYAQLSSMQDQYRALFRALGFELVCDPRGFYYFVPEQVAPQVNKTAQRLALFTFILVEHLADQGRDPLSVLDGGSIGRDELPALLEKYRDRVAHPETGLPFAPTKRDQPFTIEGLAFHTKGPLRIALKVFMPVCVVAFGVSFLWDWWGLIRSCSVAGMIGFGTNWVAIKMLFWPRESRPVFGHGLIPSQRDDLIDKVATEVLENLINEELIVQKIDETRIIERFTESAIDKLNLLVADPEFKADVRRLVLTYVGEIASNPTFRQQILTRAEGAMEEFAGDRFKGWLVHKLRDRWRAPLVRFVNQEIEGLDKTLGEGLDELDPVLEKLPTAMLARQEQIERMLTKMLIGLVNEVDLRAIVYEQLSTVTPEQLETSFREFSDDKLSYITLLGGIFGVIGGTVIVWPLPAIAVLLTLLGVLALLDVVLYRVVRASWWPRSRAGQPEADEAPLRP